MPPVSSFLSPFITDVASVVTIVSSLSGALFSFVVWLNVRKLKQRYGRMGQLPSSCKRLKLLAKEIQDNVKEPHRAHRQAKSAHAVITATLELLSGVEKKNVKVQLKVLAKNIAIVPDSWSHDAAWDCVGAVDAALTHITAANSKLAWS